MKICPTCQKTYPDDFSLCPRDGAPLTAQATETEAQLAAGLSSRFRLVRRLGAGGMGTVFLAEQVGVGNRPVALKVLNRKLLDDPDFLLRFQNEAGSTGRIHHPNVVTIYESAQADDGTPYIAMEFLDGESLREALQRRGALPVTEVADILQQAARGLNAAHRLGIIHRDLKPDNIFLTRGDEGEMVVKVVDFGIAKLRESSTHTQRGMVLGTPAYMSCEQASGMRSDELDARSDIYSLGVVVYEMLTGRVPFHSDTPLGYLRKHMLEAPPPFRAVAQGSCVPPAVEAVVMKALTKDRNQRYPSALDFARELATAAQPSVASKPAAYPRRGIPKAEPPQQASAPMKTRRSYRLAVLVLAGALGVGGYWLYRVQPGPSPTVTPSPAGELPPTKQGPPAPVVQPPTEPGGTISRQSTEGTTQKAPATTQEAPARKPLPKPAESLREPPAAVPSRVEPAPQRATQPAEEEQRAKQRQAEVNRRLTTAQQAFEQGDYDAAIRWYEAVLELDPNNQTAKDALEGVRRAKAAEGQVLRRLKQPK